MQQPPAVAALLASVLAFAPSAAAQERPAYQSEPEVLGLDAPRLDEWIPDLELELLGGRRAELAELAGERGLVIALRDVDCPVSRKLAPRTRRLEAELAERGFGLVYLTVAPAEDARRDVETFELAAAYAVDPDGRVAGALAATTTTEVFVLDAARTLVYRGMIDDQYGLGFDRPAPRREYLVEALDAVAAGRSVAVPATQAHGCLLALDAAPALERPNTWNERISRIVQRRCESCHRDGGVAPFALSDYDEVHRRRRMIKFVLEEGVMPPWFAEEGSGPWRNDASLTPEEEADLLEWARGDAPEGDPAHAPLARRYVEGWELGAPDLVVAMPEAFEVPAEGVVDYQYFEVQLDHAADLWVEAVEIRPGARQVVHHVIVWVDEPGAPRRRNGAESFYAATAPGSPALRFAAGLAKRLPAGARLTFQMHYTANGTAATDRTEVGFFFADEPVLAEVRTNSAYNDNFAIPPGAFDYEVTADFRFPVDASILTLFPHTHLRGVRFLYELVYPDGAVADLLPLPGYDFNWQLFYDLREPLEVPAGTLLRATAWYDNTEGNPANPDPSATVTFGEQTFDEMMIGYVNWVPTPASGG